LLDEVPEALPTSDIKDLFMSKVHVDNKEEDYVDTESDLEADSSHVLDKPTSGI
jgi:hypothetical protein